MCFLSRASSFSWFLASTQECSLIEHKPVKARQDPLMVEHAGASTFLWVPGLGFGASFCQNFLWEDGIPLEPSLGSTNSKS